VGYARILGIAIVVVVHLGTLELNVKEKVSKVKFVNFSFIFNHKITQEVFQTFSSTAVLVK
jgi:hypothetical protein